MTGRLQVKKGFFYIRLNYKDEVGKYKDKWIATGLPEKNNKRRAEELLRETLAKHDANPKPLTTAAMSMTALFGEYLTTKKGDLRGNTFTAYQDTANLHIIPFFERLGLSVQQMEPRHIQDYYNLKTQEGLSASTLTRSRTILRGSFDHALRVFGIISSNPCDRVKLPKSGDKRPPNFYTEEQIKILLEAVKDETIEAPVRLSVTYGICRSETCGLKWSAVDFGRKTITIRHTAVRNGTDVVYDDTVKRQARYRTFPLMEGMEAYLLELKANEEEMRGFLGEDYHDNDYICKWNDGRPLDPDYITSRFGRFLKVKGLPHIRFHDLRHSCASLLLSLGFTLKEVQEWLGHASIKSTEIYAHLLYKSKEGMADKINAALSSAEKTPRQNLFSENSENYSENRAISA